MLHPRSELQIFAVLDRLCEVVRVAASSCTACGQERQAVVSCAACIRNALSMCTVRMR